MLSKFKLTERTLEIIIDVAETVIVFGLPFLTKVIKEKIFSSNPKII